jgi:hypothetical protein
LDTFTIVIVVLTVLFVIAVIVITLLNQQKRAKEILALAAQLGYQQGDERVSLETLGGFDLSTQGHGRGVNNLLCIKSNGATVSLFDFSASFGQRKNQRTQIETVLLMQSEKLHLPTFFLHPENIGTKIKSALGSMEDINFENHPDFSKAYALEGIEDVAIREVFNNSLLDYFAQHRGLSVEGQGGKLLYYRSGKRIQSKEVQSFIEEGLKMLKMFEGV